MDVYMQCVYAFVCGCMNGFVDGSGNGFKNYIIRYRKSSLIIEIQNQNQKSQSKIRFIFSKMIFDIVKSSFEN